MSDWDIHISREMPNDYTVLMCYSNTTIAHPCDLLPMGRRWTASLSAVGIRLPSSDI
jgi:hypothetical protein